MADIYYNKEKHSFITFGLNLDVNPNVVLIHEFPRKAIISDSRGFSTDIPSQIDFGEVKTLDLISFENHGRLHEKGYECIAREVSPQVGLDIMIIQMKRESGAIRKDIGETDFGRNFLKRMSGEDLTETKEGLEN